MSTSPKNDATSAIAHCTYSHAAYRVSKAGERQGLNRDELYVNLGCFRKGAQVAGI